MSAALKTLELPGMPARHSLREAYGSVVADIRNPFLVPIHAFPPYKTLCRTWEFDAQDEAEVRKLFEEAKRDGEPQVQGMSISGIEDMTSRRTAS